jgi:predicted ATPase
VETQKEYRLQDAKVLSVYFVPGTAIAHPKLRQNFRVISSGKATNWAWEKLIKPIDKEK